VSQIPNLTPTPFSDHNSCISYLNEHWEGNLGIYTSIPFQWYHGGPIWFFKTFQPRLWTFGTHVRVQLPKWECTWESLGSFPCTLPHLWECISHPNTLS
jgi:hypothetical protein